MKFIKTTKLISIIRRQRETLEKLAVLQGWSGGINSTKSKIKHMATRDKNLSCVLEAQELQMPQKSSWVLGHVMVVTGCLQTDFWLWPWRRLL